MFIHSIYSYHTHLFLLYLLISYHMAKFDKFDISLIIGCTQYFSSVAHIRVLLD